MSHSNTTNASTEDLPQRIDRLQAQLAEWKRSSQRSSKVLLVLGFGSIALLTFYFAYAYREFNAFLQPEVIVNLVQDFGNTQLPVAREQLEAEIKRNAPTIAEGLSKQAQSSMPLAREKLAEYIVSQLDDLARETMNITDEQFRHYLRENRPTLEKAFTAMGKGPEEAEAELAEVRKSFETMLEGDTVWHSREMLRTLTDMNEKLAYLAANRELTPEEQLERRVLMLARGLQKQHMNDVAANSSASEMRE